MLVGKSMQTQTPILSFVFICLITRYCCLLAAVCLADTAPQVTRSWHHAVRSCALLPIRNCSCCFQTVCSVYLLPSERTQWPGPSLHHCHQTHQPLPSLVISPAVIKSWLIHFIVFLMCPLAIILAVVSYKEILLQVLIKSFSHHGGHKTEKRRKCRHNCLLTETVKIF